MILNVTFDHLKSASFFEAVWAVGKIGLCLRPNHNYHNFQ